MVLRLVINLFHPRFDLEFPELLLKPCLVGPSVAHFLLFQPFVAFWVVTIVPTGDERITRGPIALSHLEFQGALHLLQHR